MATLHTARTPGLLGVVVRCPACHAVYLARTDSTVRLTASSPLQRLWAPGVQPLPLRIGEQPTLLRNLDGKPPVSRPIEANPFVLPRSGALGPDALPGDVLARTLDGPWLIVAGPGVPLQADGIDCEAAVVPFGAGFVLAGRAVAIAVGSLW